MELFGTSRSRVGSHHALICPDSFVRSPLPGWTKSHGIILIAPRMGARFTQYLAVMEPGATAGPAAPGVERVAYVLDGEIEAAGLTATAGGFVFAPADEDVPLRARTPARLNIFEKQYVPLAGVAAPVAIIAQEQEVEGVPFLGDPAARLQVLLPDAPAFDLAVNVFRFQPGAALPMVEVHLMEHGLLMIAGQGVYRLGDDWYPVTEGDVIWMAPFCPQWFVAMGKQPAAYLYYKDVNRDPLA